MHASIPVALSERPGPEAIKGLVDLFVTEEQLWGERVLTTCTERFERRLVKETSKLRVEMSEMKAELRAEMGTLRNEIATTRVELLKWAFLSWAGQLAGVAAIMSLMLRTLPGR